MDRGKDEGDRAGLIAGKVHKLYWEQDINCARTMLICLADCFGIELQEQTMASATGLHGAGGYRAQCGLVEGALMFLGVYFHGKGKSDDEIAGICFMLAERFENEFGSLRCFNLRPGGFRTDDPPHACEGLTGRAIEFVCGFIEDIS